MNKYFIMFFIFIAAMLSALSFGGHFINIFNHGLEDALILRELRFPRVLTCAFVGGVLSIAGLFFQSLFRNDLATPYTLGVATGGSLGAMIAISSGAVVSIYLVDSVTIFAFLGAILTITILTAFNNLFHSINNYTLILCGVALSMFFSSIVLLLQFLNLQVDGIRMIRWLMGSVDVVGYSSLWSIMIICIPILLISVMFLKDLNLLYLGDEFAHTHGVNVKKTQNKIFILTSFLIAPVVASFGPIGFVGMIIPHIAKKLYNKNHMILFPVCFIFGATFLMLCDLLSRVILTEGNLPLGVVTSFIGGPFFLWIIFRSLKSG
ncbi:iron ABC transporter permease [Bacteriovoracaceae bacterium]|nr:iron ABC transporter permease [Bacteriovoracaceae bacterium]